MDQSEIADIIEIEQLLARYAVGMTRDDIDAVIDVFTPDGTYSAFGDTYALADFPELVRAAPKGLFLTGTPVLELDGRHRHGAADALLRRPDHARHAHRLVHRHLPADGAGVAAADPVHDLPPAQRRPGLGKAARPHPARALGGRGRLSGAAAVELGAFKAAVDDWLDEHARELAPTFEGIGTLDEQMAQLRKVMRLTYDAGFMRMGWPERVGGLGGSNLLRAYLGEVLTARDLVEPGIYSMPEVLAPTMIDYAPAGAGGRHGAAPAAGRGDLVPGLLRAGYGEQPGLARLPGRPATGDGWRINGQKVWTSLAQYAQRCVLLTRTGTPESAHRGITALFVDMDSPGITVRPIETMHGAREFCEVFFDDVVVPRDRVLGEVDRGWSIAMDLLPYERSTALWHRAAYLQRRLEQLRRPSLRPARSTPPRSARPPSCCGRSGPARGRRSAGWRPARRWEPRPPSTRCSWRRPSRRCSTSSAEGLGAEVATRGRPGQPALAGRVPLLPRRHHLRRQRRDPAQHHRPPPPRPRGRPLMEAAERALFDERRASRHRVGRRRSARRRARRPRLARRAGRRPRHRRPVLFECLGAANATSAALDWLLAAALGAAAGRHRRRPARAPRPCDPRGALRRRPVHGARDWAPRRWSAPTRCSSWQRRPPASRRARSRPARCERRPVHGLDPALGLFEVTGRFDVDPATDRSARPTGTARVAARAARPRLRARRRCTRHARAGPRARAGAHPVRAPDRHLPGRAPPAGRDAWSRWRPPPPCSTPPGRTPPPSRPAMAKAFAGRSARTRGPPLPAGAGRHRLHHRAPAAPLRPADDRAGPAARRGQPR